MPKLTATKLKAQPSCIYCGGTEPAVQVDHVPPRGLFDGRWRPQGLEVSACDACHQGTREVDAVAAMISRVFPSPTTEEQRQDSLKTIAGFVRNFPHLAEEMGKGKAYVGPNGEEGFAIRANGPIMTSAMLTFGARLAFALHHEITKEILRPAARVFVRWHSNVSAFEGRLPTNVLEILGPGRTLVQGQKHVSGQFDFYTASPGDTGVFPYWAEFRQSFAILAFVSPGGLGLEVAQPEDLFSPGFLRGYSVFRKNGPWPGPFAFPFGGYRTVSIR